MVNRGTRLVGRSRASAEDGKMEGIPLRASSVDGGCIDGMRVGVMMMMMMMIYKE